LIGGTKVQIQGKGFSSNTNQVVIDGVNCEVIYQSKYFIECITGEKASVNPNIGTSMPGTHGV